MAQKIQPNDPRITIANPSVRTITERNRFAAQLDDFATFYWANTDMFANFGAFIINEKKGSLKLYNGPSFKNNYSKPQFQDGYTNLTGVTFDTQTISFTVGVWWISIEDYRILINFLHPYEVNMLCFGFEKTYGYFCKLQSIKDSTRYIVGTENHVDDVATDSLSNSRLNSGNTSGARYYTELQLTFELIGAQCAKEIESICLPSVGNNSSSHYGATWTWDPNNPNTISLNFGSPVINSNFISDLDYPFEIKLPHLYLNDLTENGVLLAQATLVYVKDGVTLVQNTKPLFKISLKNIDSNTSISLKYNSEHGILYWEQGNQTKLLNLLSTQLNGQRILNYLDINSFAWPGKLTLDVLPDCFLEISFTWSNLCLWPANGENIMPYITYTAQRRTNII